MTDESPGQLDTRGTRGAHTSEMTVHRQISRVAGIFDAVPIGVAVWSVDGELLYANPVQCDLFAQSRSELAGQHFENFIHPSLAPSVRRFVEDVWRGERNYFSSEVLCRGSDGADLWLQAELTAVYGADARPSYLLSQIFDFSGRRGKRGFSSSRLENSPAMLWWTDEHAIPREGNQASYAFLGRTRLDGELEQGLYRHGHAEDFEEIGRELRKCVQEQLPLDFVARARRGDGEWRWMWSQAEPRYAEGGAFVGYAGVSTDVTIYEEMRADLEGTRSLFRTITEAGPLAVARLDRNGLLTYANRRWAELIDDHMSRLAGLNWQELLAPDEVEEIVGLGATSISTGQAFSYRVLASERIRVKHDAIYQRPAGEGPARYWVEIRVMPVFADDGSHDGWVATLTDVSREIEAGTRADSLANVLDAGSDFLMIAERNGVISYLNKAAQEGLRVGPLDPSTNDDPAFLWDVLDADSFEFFHDHVDPALSENGIWRGELVMRSRQGAPIPVSALFLAHNDERGHIESISAVARDISDLKEAQGQLEDLATHDYLTGMPNRVLLYDRLEQALARHKRYGQPGAVLYLDLDDFKPVNDAHGHHAGDGVLQEVASRIYSVVRDADTAARLGGDEFCVLVEGVDDRALLSSVADRLIERISEPIVVEGLEAAVGVSIGMVCIDGSEADADALLALADAAMYRAKATGRGRFVFHESEHRP